MSDPVVAWLIQPKESALDRNALAWVTREPREAACAPNHGFTVTPLVAAPPGAPTYADLLDALREDAEIMEQWAVGSREGGWSTHQVDASRSRASDLRALLSRIPKQQEGSAE